MSVYGNARFYSATLDVYGQAYLWTLLPPLPTGTINTEPKRAAALQFGRPFRITLPPPDGVSTPLERAHGVSCYYVEPSPFGVPRCGWTVAATDRIFWIPSSLSVIQVSANDDVFSFRSCP